MTHACDTACIFNKYGKKKKLSYIPCQKFTMSDANIKNDENFLKEFLRDFYQKIINTDDFINKVENVLSEWIRNIDKNTKSILELMENHEKNEFWFISIIGFFYQYGIGCDVDKNKALELYLLAVSNEKFSDIKSLQEIVNEFEVLLLRIPPTTALDKECLREKDFVLYTGKSR